MVRLVNFVLSLLATLPTLAQTFTGSVKVVSNQLPSFAVVKLLRAADPMLAQDTVTGPQSSVLTAQQQNDDFDVFKGGLQEGHGGLYYFIDKAVFDRKCDSVQQTFTDKASVEAYYLKLRYLITLLRHGHSRINLPVDRFENYKLGILNRDRLYLPLQLTILAKKLYVLGDCSREQTVPKGSQIERINGVPVTQLIDSMLHYIPADGINTTFKYYNLYNYYNFHFLYNLFYPTTTKFTIRLAGKLNPVQIEGRTPSEMEKTNKSLTSKSLSHFDNPLGYRPAVAPNTAYLKVGSFYKGFIENFGNRYEPFIDSVFRDLNACNIKNLILDLRNNEGGGDNYEYFLFGHLSEKPFNSYGFDKVAAKAFPFVKYAVNLSDDVRGYIDNPMEFLRDDSTLVLKQKYINVLGQGLGQPANDQFRGAIYVLINEGVFSAGNRFVQSLYDYRKSASRKIVFVGEENGGDIYSDVLCAGQGYTIKLPNSAITVDMPFLCSGTLNKIYPAKQLPDITVTERIEDVIAGKDGVLQAVLKKISED